MEYKDFDSSFRYVTKSMSLMIDSSTINTNCSSQNDFLANKYLVDLENGIPEIIDQIINQENPDKNIEALSNYLKTTDTNIHSAFENPSLVGKFLSLLQSSECLISTQANVLICISNILYLTDFSIIDSLWLSEEVIDVIIATILSSNVSILPFSYFTLARYASISADEILFLSNRGILDKLYDFTRIYTSPNHIMAGLAMAMSMLLHRIDDIYEKMLDFIPCFRCLIMNIEPKIRNMACGCLIKLCDYEPAIQECIEDDVPIVLVKYISKQPNEFVENIFQLVYIFLNSDARSIFLTKQFIASLVKILKLSKSEPINKMKLGNIFLVLISIENDTRSILEELDTFILSSYYASCSYISLKVKATIFLALGILNGSQSTRLRLIHEYNAFESICSILAISHDTDGYKHLLSAIYHILFIDIESFFDIFIKYGVYDNIEIIEEELPPVVRVISDSIKNIVNDHIRQIQATG